MNKFGTERPVKGDDRHEEVEFGVLGTYVGFYLRLAQTASFRAFKRTAGVQNLRPGWFAVLSIIGDNPGVTPILLSRASGRDKSTITPVLRELVREGYLVREANPVDRRSYGLHLTEAGREALAHLAEAAAAHERDLDDIAGGEKPALMALLRRITSELD